jgi:GNAT superfamily N-acetyltransferase
MTGALWIARLRPGDVPAAVDLLSRAFARDPILTNFFKGPRRRVGFALLFADVILAHRALGHAYVLREGNRPVAVALWTPPQMSAPTALERLRAALFSRALRLVYPGAAIEVEAGFAKAAHLHPSEPHWYLAFVGVEPRRQGTGLGAAVLAPVLALADAEQRICYLETPFPRTHAFYRRLGFEVTRELRPFRGAPPIWTLVRSPLPAS